MSLDRGTTGNATIASVHLRHWRIPGVVVTLLGLAALLLRRSIEPDDWWTVGVFIVLSGLPLIPMIWRGLRQSTLDLMADHFFVLAAAFLVYSVLGALLIPFGPQEQADAALSYYAMDAQMAMRVTAVNCVGFGLALIVGSLVRRSWISGLASKAVGFGSFMSAQWTMLLFLIIGGACSAYVFRFDLYLETGVMAGTVRTLSSLLLVTIILAAAYTGRASGWFLSGAVLLTSVLALAGFLLLSKSSALLPIVALMSGLIWRFGIRRVIVPGLIALLAVFLLIGSPINTARNSGALSGQIGVDERADILREGVLDPGGTMPEESYQPWARLCYLPPQAAAMDLYDAGQGGNDYELMGWSFLPRVLFPTKPVMTMSSTEFYEKIVGRNTTSVGQGVFVDGYYNLGWWGVIAVGIAVGGILAWTSAFASVVYRSRSTLWLPIALGGSLMAFRIDGGFLVDYWGLFVLTVYASFGGAIVQTLILRRQR
jgi:hypothetical protein